MATGRMPAAGARMAVAGAMHMSARKISWPAWGSFSGSFRIDRLVVVVLRGVRRNGPRQRRSLKVHVKVVMEVA